MGAEPGRPECEDADYTFTFSVEDLDLLVALVTMHHMKTHGMHWSMSCNMSICKPCRHIGIKIYAFQSDKKGSKLTVAHFPVPV